MGAEANPATNPRRGAALIAAVLLAAPLITGCGSETTTARGRGASWQACTTPGVRAATSIIPATRSRRPPDPLGPHGGLTKSERRTGTLIQSRVVRIETSDQVRRDKPTSPALENSILDPPEIGNGFILDSGAIITAAHAVGTSEVWIEHAGKHVHASVSRRDVVRDLAMLTVSPPLRVAGTIGVATSSDRQQPALIWSRQRQSTATAPVLRPNRVRVLPGAPSHWQDITAPAGTPVHSARRACGGDLERGRSGSPVLTPGGQLIGLAVAKGGQSSNVDGTLIGAVPVDWLP